MRRSQMGKWEGADVRKQSSWGLALLAAIAMELVSGCGPSMGAWFYTLGMVPNQKSTAEYKLPSGSVLVLVDDDQDLIEPPLARKMLVDSLAKQLKEHKITDRVTTNEEIARLRQSEPNFDQRGAREVGRLAKADTVVWLSVKQFSVETNLELSVSPGTFSANLKVVNANAEKREDVRLWPMDREGRLIVATVPAHQIRACKSQSEVHEKLAETMADSVAKLFYDYEIPQ